MAFFMYGLWLVFDKRSCEIVGRAGIENRGIFKWSYEAGIRLSYRLKMVCVRDMATRLQKLSWITLLEILALINFFCVPI